MSLGIYNLISLTASDNIRLIRLAMNEIESKTCVKFIPRQFEADFVEIYSGDGCSASVGRRRGRQNLSLRISGCIHHGIVIHELLHSLGFYHMQSSYDRDEHVRVIFENVLPGREHNFRKYSNKEVSNYQTHYDLDSILHYGRGFFSKNGRNTIETMNPSDITRIGQRRGLSIGDVQRVRNMYCL